MQDELGERYPAAKAITETKAPEMVLVPALALMASEQLNRLGNLFDPALGARALAWGGGVEDALNPKSKVVLPQGDIQNWSVFSAASLGERSLSQQPQTIENWKDGWKTYLSAKTNDPFYLILGKNLVGATGPLNAGQIATLSEHFSSYYREGGQDIDVQKIFSDLSAAFKSSPKVLEDNLPELSRLMGSIMGDHCGRLFAQGIVAAIAADADMQAAMKAQINILGPDQVALLEVVTGFNMTGLRLIIDRQRALQSKSEEIASAAGNKREDQEKPAISLTELQKNSAVVGGSSDIGNDTEKHPKMQDSYGFFTDERKTVAVVADGITKTDGDSLLAAQNAAEKITSSLSVEKEYSQSIFDDAYTRASSSNPDGDTTVSVAVLTKDHILRHSNVGDSPIFYFDGSLHQVSRPDLSYDANGVLIPGGISQTLLKHTDVHYGETPIPPGSLVVLLTDGVANKLGNAGITQILAENKSRLPGEISNALIAAAKALGCENVTAVIMQG